MDKDTVIAYLGASVALAGLLLVFSGYVYSHSESFNVAARKKKYQWIAKAGLIPFAIALLAAWISVNWLENQFPERYHLALILFKMSLISTLLYGIISMIFYL